MKNIDKFRELYLAMLSEADNMGWIEEFYETYPTYEVFIKLQKKLVLIIHQLDNFIPYSCRINKDKGVEYYWNFNTYEYVKLTDSSNLKKYNIKDLL